MESVERISGGMAGQDTLKNPVHLVATTTAEPLNPFGSDAPASSQGIPSVSGLAGKRVGMVLFSSYPNDPRPRRAIDALLQQGMTVELICLADDGAAKRESLDGLEIFRIPITQERGGKFSYAYRYSSFIAASAAILAWRSLKHRYQLVYVHNMPDVLVLSALIPKALGAKVILDLHDPMPELATTIFGLDEQSLSIRIVKWLEKWSLARADLVLTVNIACKRIFGSRSCASEKIGVVMNSPDAQIFPLRPAQVEKATAKLSHRPFVIMYHGSLVERNGLELAVEALSHVQQSVPLAELRIYGRKTPFLERVMEIAAKKGLQESVRFLGPKRLEELAPAIESCDIGVIPNHRNAFTEINTPTRIFEYLALGKPVIAPSTPGILDYFTKDSLFLFESGNASDLARKIEQAAGNYHEAVRTAERGQRIYLQHTWKQQREILVSLVSRLLTVGEA